MVAAHFVKLMDELMVNKLANGEIQELPEAKQAQLLEPLDPQGVTKMEFGSKLHSIKPIYITERLNDVFGVNGWHMAIMPVEEENNYIKPGLPQDNPEVMFKVYFWVPEFGIRREIVASSSNRDVGDAAKGAVSDCLSKIGSMLGIGHQVYKGLHGTGPKLDALNPSHPDWAKVKQQAANKEVTLEELQKIYTVDSRAQKLLKL